MTKQEARRKLQRDLLPDNIEELIPYVGNHFLLNEHGFYELKSIIEAISDGEYTAELSESQDKYGRYAVDIVENQIYTDYWS